MKNKFTKNIGLKILSVVVAFFLWLIVVNVDDPVISRTYSGIGVELVNTEVLANEGKSYEVLNNTDTINVVVSAKRSVLDEVSKDDIRAVADFTAMTHNGTVPIEVRCRRYSDRIDSVTTRTENLLLALENIIEREFSVSVICDGEPSNGFIVSDVDLAVSSVIVTGPESLIDEVSTAVVNADIAGIKKDMSVTHLIKLTDSVGRLIEDSRLEMSDNSTEVTIVVNQIKEVPISCGFSGNPVGGYAVNGMAMANPSSVRLTGRGENFDDIDVIYISPDDVSVEGAMAEVKQLVDISNYLPTGVSFADEEFNPIVEVTVAIEPTEHKVISVPISNITIENIPDGYIAAIVDIGTNVEVEIQGLGDTFDRYSGDLAIGVIDATQLVPRKVNPDAMDAPLQTGENDGIVTFDLPTGVSVVNPLSMMVVVDYIGETESTGSDTTAGAASLTSR